MGDVMFFGILRMPYNMAMANEISRHQYWQSGQQAADEIERLREALQYYAEKKEDDWKNGDDGVVARFALQQKESE